MKKTKRPEVSEIFTPRRSEVNEAIYVHRPNYEKEIERGIKGSLHPVVSGDSGSGKSWLYRKVLDSIGCFYSVANLANASRFGSITSEIINACIPEGNPKKVSYNESKSVSLGALGSGASLEHQGSFTIQQKEPLLEAFSSLEKRASGRTPVLVLDNLERIFNQEDLMRELGDIITLIDDPNYSASKTTLLIVGVPRDINQYFSKTEGLATVGNRLKEIREVEALSKEQTFQLVDKGFINGLKVEIEPMILEFWKAHIYEVTLGIAQRIHEYCECLGYIVEDSGWEGSYEQIEDADRDWLTVGLKQCYHVVESMLNEKVTKAGRRNQVLFSLGRSATRRFSVTDVESQVRHDFPKSTEDLRLGIGPILADLENRENSFIRRAPKSREYEFTDPRYRMCLRTMLLRDENEKVGKLELQEQ